MVGEGTWVRRELGSRAAGSKQSGKLSLAVSMNIGAGAAASRLEVGFGPLEGSLGAGMHGKFLALAPTSNVIEGHSKATCTKSPQISPAVRPSAPTSRLDVQNSTAAASRRVALETGGLSVCGGRTLENCATEASTGGALRYRWYPCLMDIFHN
jgi:hypothetical protein